MKKSAAAALLVGVALLLLVFAGTASADPEFKVCHKPPDNPAETITVGSFAAVLAHLAHGDTPGPCGSNGPSGDGSITVTNEPPGENCVNGGIKVVVQHGKKDADNLPSQIPPGAVEPSEDPGQVTTNGEGPPLPRVPKLDPPDEVFYVCNGATGPAGPPGPQGPAGPPGAVQLPNGGIGIPTVTPPKVCQSSTRIGVRLFLPPRLARFGVVRLQIAKVNGPLRLNRIVRTRVPLRNPNGPVFVFVPVRARNCGSYLITVSRPGVEPVIQIWQITGRFGLKRTTITG